MLQLVLMLGRIILVAAILLLTMLVVMTLIAVQVGAVSAVFVRPDAPGPFDSLFLSPNYVDRTLQITGLVLAYEFYLLIAIMLFPFFLASGDFRWWG